MNLKYCNLCRTQYEHEPHVCEDEGSFDPETKQINRVRKIECAFREDNKKFEAHTKAFWERMKELTWR